MAVLPDGSGGWFVGGQFISVGGITHEPGTRAARQLGRGMGSCPQRHRARPGAAQRVLYVGGDFTTLGGVTRNRIGAVDVATDVTTSWNPNANSSVRGLAAGASVLYVGGQFTTIGGQARNRIAALNFATGAADPAWNPNANSLVMTLWFDPLASLVYAGGQFTSIDGQTRNRIAALDASSGHATAWRPEREQPGVRDHGGGGTVYAGGLFTTIGGQSRSRIAALDAGTGLATAWNPNASTTVNALALSGSVVYAGGDFLSIGGQNRSRVAALDVATGLASAWNRARLAPCPWCSPTARRSTLAARSTASAAHSATTSRRST
jgi:hypothetical protein